MAPSPITLWQIEGEKVEAMTDFIFLGSQFTAGRRCLLLGREVMTSVDSILKSKDITLLTRPI